MKQLLAVFAAAFLLLGTTSAQQLSSPGGTLQLTFTLVDSIPYY